MFNKLLEDPTRHIKMYNDVRYKYFYFGVGGEVSHKTEGVFDW